jgi:hypothetical protein
MQSVAFGNKVCLCAPDKASDRTSSRHDRIFCQSDRSLTKLPEVGRTDLYKQIAVKLHSEKVPEGIKVKERENSGSLTHEKVVEMDRKVEAKKKEALSKNVLTPFLSYRFFYPREYAVPEQKTTRSRQRPYLFERPIYRPA